MMVLSEAKSGLSSGFSAQHLHISWHISSGHAPLSTVGLKTGCVLCFTLLIISVMKK